ncbi:acyltransferase family protein [Xanthobacter autotrophicus]|uniref:acyltransferase family protein n=1 Tax=Xanthobacter autotrophicus TaxID=280 RepID=UPI00372AD936
MPLRSDRFFQWLDLFRWLAALAVVFTHANNRFFTKVLSLPPTERSIGHYAFAIVSGFGWPAVMIFFVLSGYLVGGIWILKYQKDNNYSVVDYAVARLTRLWIVLIPAILLTFVFNIIGIHLFNGMETGIYTLYGSEGNVTLLHDAWTASCNIAFFQSALCFQYGGNGALWSLFNEFWYYVAFPFVLLGFFSNYSTYIRLAFVGMAGALLIFLGQFQFISAAAPLAPYFLLWCLGIVVALRDRPFIPMPPWLAAGLFLSYLLVWRTVPSSFLESQSHIRFATDLVLTGLFAHLLMVMKADSRLPAPPLPGVSKALAGFSFSLYCINMPVLNLYAAAVMHWFETGWKLVPRGIVDYLIALGGVAFSLLLAYLFSLATERNTSRIRALVSSRIGWTSAARLAPADAPASDGPAARDLPANGSRART